MHKLVILFLALLTVAHNCRAADSTDAWSLLSQGGTVLSRGYALGAITRPCKGDQCQMCVQSKCYGREYQSLMIYDGCPPAACDFGCGELVFGPDQCPICQCSGFSTREPCSAASDCSEGGRCQDSLCRYPSTSGRDRACNLSGMYKPRKSDDPSFGRRSQCFRSKRRS